MAAPSDQLTKATPKELVPLKPIMQQGQMDLSLEANKHPKEAPPKNQSTEPLTPSKLSSVELDIKDVQKYLKQMVDTMCRCKNNIADITIGECSLDTEHFMSPDKLLLTKQMFDLEAAVKTLAEHTKNAGPPESPFPMEISYKKPIVRDLVEDASKVGSPLNTIKSSLLTDDKLTLESTQKLLDDTIDLARNINNVMIQVDKLKTANKVDWQMEQIRLERKKEEEEAHRKHEDEVRPLRAEKAVIDHNEKLISGIIALPEKLQAAKQLTDPALQQLPKYIKRTKDGYDPDPLASEDDLFLVAAGPIGVAGLLATIGYRAIARKANTVRELNPKRPTSEQISQGLTALSGEIQSIKEQAQVFSSMPAGRNPDASWNTIQELSALRTALPKAAPMLDELEDLPNKVGVWDLPTIRACILRAESNPDLQEVFRASKALSDESNDLKNQIDPPKKPARDPYWDPYHFTY